MADDEVMQRGVRLPERDVHLIVNEDSCAVYQEDSVLASGLTWSKAVGLARSLGGKIVLHETLESALADHRLARVAKSL